MHIWCREKESHTRLELYAAGSKVAATHSHTAAEAAAAATKGGANTQFLGTENFDISSESMRDTGLLTRVAKNLIFPYVTIGK